VSAFTVIVEPDVVHDQIAAAPETLELLILTVGVQQETPLWGSLGANFGMSLPLVADPDLPPGEIHMRRVSPIPFTKAQQADELRQMLDWYAEMMPGSTEAGP
jgi:hypothetical protein